MRPARMLMQFGQIAACLWYFVLYKRYHTRQRSPISVEETFYNVLHAIPLYFNTQTFCLNMVTDKVDDHFSRGAWTKTTLYTHRFNCWQVFIWQDTSGCDEHIIYLVLPQQFHNFWENCHVSARKNTQEDSIHVFLNRRLYD